MYSLGKAFAPAAERQHPDFQGNGGARRITTRPLADRLAPASLTRQTIGELEAAAHAPLIQQTTANTTHQIEEAVGKPAA